MPAINDSRVLNPMKRFADYSAMPIFAPSLRAVNAMATNRSTINTPSAQT
jgi:hypothetical protein